MLHKRHNPENLNSFKIQMRTPGDLSYVNKYIHISQIQKKFDYLSIINYPI